MARFYNPRDEKANQPVDTPVGYRGRVQYDPRQDSGSSGGETSDITPERQYSVDLRRLDPEERSSVDNTINRKEFSYPKDQQSIEKKDYLGNAIKATRLSSKYQQQQNIKRPIIGNETARNSVMTNFRSFGYPFGGQELPSLGEAPGARGSINYPNGPQPRSGKPYNWRDSFG